MVVLLKLYTKNCFFLAFRQLNHPQCLILQNKNTTANYKNSMKKIIITMLLAVILPKQIVAQTVAHVPQTPSKHYNDRVLLFENSAPIDSTNIVMLGNSLTENLGDWNELIGDTDSLIINRGIIGDTANGMKARLCQILPGHPKALFLMCGINDISHHLTPETIFTRIVDITDSIRSISPNTIMYIQSVLPFVKNSRWRLLKGKTNDVVALNSLIQKFCNDNNITFVNIFPKLCKSGTNELDVSYSVDGLHINKQGYEIWAEELRPYIKQILNKK